MEKVHEDMRTGSVTTGLLGDSFHDRMRELILRQEVRAVTMAKKDVSAVAGVLRENVRAAAIILHEVESDGDSESATQGLERILEILEHVTELKYGFH